jgi:hypothetical protein
LRLGSVGGFGSLRISEGTFVGCGLLLMLIGHILSALDDIDLSERSKRRLLTLIPNGLNLLLAQYKWLFHPLHLWRWRAV